MRNIFTLCFLLAFFLLPVNGQLTKDHNHLRTGDELVKWQVAYKDPGKGGNNRLWDFSKLKPVSEEYVLTYSSPGMVGDSVYIMGRDSVPAAGVSENDLVTATEHFTMYYYRLSGDSLFRLGHENPGTQLFYTRPQLVLKYPLNYGDVHVSEYSGEGLYGGQVAIKTKGSVRTHADGFGSMVLPSGDTLTSVLRVKTTQSIMELTDEQEGQEGTYVFDRVLETHQWYTRGYRYPVFETVRSVHLRDSAESFATAFFFPPQDHLYLESDPENKAMLDSLWDIRNQPGSLFDENYYAQSVKDINYRIYPNPVQNDLHIDISLQQAACLTLFLYDTTGRLVYHSALGEVLGEDYSYRIDCSGLAPGIYMLKILTGQQVISQKIIRTNP